MPKPYGEDAPDDSRSHWIDRAVQAEFRAEKFETALSKEVLAVIQKAAQAAQGCVADPAKVAAYCQTNGGTEAWTKEGNHEPRVHTLPHGAPLFGHTHNPFPDLTLEGAIGEQFKALWTETMDLDETIDKVSQRVDRLDLEVRSFDDAGQNLLLRINALEQKRCDDANAIIGLLARVEKLEGGNR